jgi:L-threonylcarbamoyladenylate synthase
MGNFHLNLAVKTLNQGGIIAYPTEAVFGLGCIPEDVFSVARILSLKGRSVSKGLILVAASPEQLEPYVDYSDNELRQKVSASWPGAVTWVLPATAIVPGWITGYKDRVAVRVSAHPVVQALCKEAGVIVSTSANPARKIPATNAFRVRSYFGNEIDYILSGNTGGKELPTEIRDAISGNVLRIGD